MDQKEITDIPAVVLAGGLGTRLRQVLPSIPKPLAKVGCKPFLRLIIHQLVNQGIRQIVICTGYLADQIEREVGGLFPKSDWTLLSHHLIWHGRRVCHARRPACGACSVAALCPSFGTGPVDPAIASKLVKPGPFS